MGRFLDYKMSDDKPIMEQVHEYQNIVLEILVEGMVIDDAFQAAALIEKLPPKGTVLIVTGDSKLLTASPWDWPRLCQACIPV